jgi:hypothetical protein
MGYQFIHLESYARKADAKGRSTCFIFAEASRKLDASVHVQNSLAPIVVYGVGVEAVQEIHDTAAAASTIAVKGGHVRRLAKDKKTLHTVVASYPATMDEIRDDPTKRKDAEKWERLTVEWLRLQYGNDLKSVIRHEDEEYFHIHAFVVPLDEPGMSALKYHPGTTAKREIMALGPAEGEDTKSLSKRADAAYKSAMRKWQDSYHYAVAIPCGLTRLGPQRRRLSREEWQREQSQAASLQKALERARRVKSDGDAFILRTKEQAAALTDAADKEKQAAAEATKQAEHAQASAGQVLAKIERYTGWIGFLRAVWDRMRQSSISEKFMLEAAEEIQKWRLLARAAVEKGRDEERRRRGVEQQAQRAQERATYAELAAARLSATRRTAKPEILVGPRR